jgi:cation diffusion facilitator family transporter
MDDNSMHTKKIDLWQHSHVFGQDLKRPGEVRTVIVVLITGAMMVVEIATGIMFGSMALLADGMHMASHAVALGISVFAYAYARRHAHDKRFNFGTGKVNALGGFSGAVLLAVFALIMAWESAGRFIHPVEIAFNQAILVAVLGLLVNGASVFILGHKDHDGDDRPTHAHAQSHEEPHHHDHNLRSAYLHVLADALTSLLAIFALLAGKYLGLIWMDPLMGIVGAILVSRWSLGLLRVSGATLLDFQGPKQIQDAIRQNIEQHNGNRVADLHVWSIGPGIYAAILCLVTDEPIPVDRYKDLMPKDMGLRHVTVEVHRCIPEVDGEDN